MVCFGSVWLENGAIKNSAKIALSAVGTSASCSIYILHAQCNAYIHPRYVRSSTKLQNSKFHYDNYSSYGVLISIFINAVVVSTRRH